MEKSELGYWLWLSAETGVNPGAKAAVVAHYGGARQAFFAPAGEYARIKGVSARDAAQLERRSLAKTERIAAACAARGIEIITMADVRYPNRLKNIYAPPAVIYVLGKLPEVDENAAIAVIGTRRASPYGLKMSRRLAYELCRDGGLVISLLTAGADEAAARGALDAAGPCIGVLGTSHDHDRSALVREVALNGAVVSEYPPGTDTKRSFFRDRNRIAAGLCVGVVVTEAPERSGTRLFVSEAAEQGKELFAVPGNADSECSVGANELLKEGAKPVTLGWDILSEFYMLFPDKLRESLVCADVTEEKKGEEAPKSDKKVIDNENTAIYSDQIEWAAELGEEQRRILEAVEHSGGSSMDDIIEATGLGTAKVLSQLTFMEIRGYIRRQSGRRVVSNTAKK